MSRTPETGIYMDSHYNLVYPKGATHLDGVDAATMEVIHDHWGTFPPQHPLVASIVGISFFVLWIINFFGNGSVCYIFLKVKSLRTPSNLFVVNLAFSDLCMMTTMGLPVVINAFTQRYWMWGAFGKRLCNMHGKLSEHKHFYYLRMSPLWMPWSHLWHLLYHVHGFDWLR